MVVFGNKTHMTEQDKIANFGFGSLQVTFFLIALPLNLFIYYFHRKKRVSWTARFYRYLSAAGIALLLLGALPQSVYLLMTESVVDVNMYVNEVFAVLCMGLWSFQKIAITMLCLMQYIYIHRPYWALVYGTKFKRGAMFALSWVVVFYVVAFTLSLTLQPGKLFGFSNHNQIFYSQGSAAMTARLVVMHLTEFGCCVASLVLYLVTIIKLKRSVEVEATPKMRADFRVIGIYLFYFTAWATVRIVLIASTWALAIAKASPGALYFSYFMGNVSAPLFTFISAISVVAWYADVRRSLGIFLMTGKVNTIDYEEL